MTHLRRNTIVERISDGAIAVMSRKPDDVWWPRFTKGWPSSHYRWMDHPVTDEVAGDAWSNVERASGKAAGKPTLSRKGL